MEEIIFRQLVPSLQSTTQTKQSPLTGKITRLLFHYPAGCNALVDAIIQKGTAQIFPFPPDVLSLDDVTATFPMNEGIEINEYIQVVLLNHDNVNAHTITVTMHIDGKGEGENK